MKKSAYKVSTRQAKPTRELSINIHPYFLLRNSEAGFNSAAQAGLKFTVIFLPQTSAWITGVSYIWLYCIFQTK